MAAIEVEKRSGLDSLRAEVNGVITKGLGDYTEVMAYVYNHVVGMFPDKPESVVVDDPRANKNHERPDTNGYCYLANVDFPSADATLTLGISPMQDRSMSGRSMTAALDLSFSAPGRVSADDARKLTQLGISTTNVQGPDGMVTTIGRRIGAGVPEADMQKVVGPFINAVSTLANRSMPKL